MDLGRKLANEARKRRKLCAKCKYDGRPPSRNYGCMAGVIMFDDKKRCEFFKPKTKDG